MIARISLSDIWNFIEDVAKTHSGYSELDIFSLVETNDMQAHGIKGKCGFITQILQYPQSRVLLVLFGGGRNIAEWKDQIWPYFEGFARENNCDEVQMMGREGWIKIFPDARTGWCIYRRGLDKEGITLQ
jgi:hypothetical protein